MTPVTMISQCKCKIHQISKDLVTFFSYLNNNKIISWVQVTQNLSYQRLNNLFFVRHDVQCHNREFLLSVLYLCSLLLSSFMCFSFCYSPLCLSLAYLFSYCSTPSLLCLLWFALVPSFLCAWVCVCYFSCEQESGTSNAVAKGELCSCTTFSRFLDLL